MSVQARLNRLFAPDGKCFDVAIDHGFFNESSFLGGIENLDVAIKTVVNANPDAIQLPPGGAKLLQAIPGRAKPSLVLRTDIANVYGQQLPSKLISILIDRAVEQAVSLDAACVVVNLLQLPNQPELYEACLKNIGQLKPLCERNGMPLMVEPLVMQDNSASGGYMVNGNIDLIMPLVRQAMELGADIIKADPTTNIAEYHRVIEIACGVPVLVRGGGRTPDEEILSRTYHLMQQGAKGIVYGRNVIQHRNPAGMTRALMSIVHEEMTSEQAMKFL
jgi:fructose-bisphosphate aldolase, class I